MHSNAGATTAAVKTNADCCVYADVWPGAIQILTEAMLGLAAACYPLSIVEAAMVKKKLEMVAIVAQMNLKW
eukprot:13403251-Ditylum_brightwellii.AAC.1